MVTNGDEVFENEVKLDEVDRQFRKANDLIRGW